MIRFVCIVVLSIGLVAPAIGDDAPVTSRPADGAYRLAAGPYKTGAKELTLHDAKRDVDVPVRVRYPRDVKSPVPLIIFSHGMGGSNNAFSSLTDHWASYGYVVILPTHADSLLRQKPEDRGELLHDPKAYRFRVDPAGRVADVRTILDSLDEIESQVAALHLPDGHGVIDRDHVAMSGHSAGALTTQMEIGVRIRTVDTPRLHDAGDARFDCAIVISGQGLTTRMLDRTSWSEVKKPMLVITGSNDTTPASDETPESRRHPYEYASPGDKFLLFIEGATHSSYQGNDRQSRAARRLLKEPHDTDLKLIGNAVSSQTLAFLDVYLKNDPAAREFLSSDAVAKMDGKVKAEHK